MEIVHFININLQPMKFQFKNSVFLALSIEIHANTGAKMSLRAHAESFIQEKQRLHTASLCTRTLLKNNTIVVEYK
jgi:hypothetical protein